MRFCLNSVVLFIIMNTIIERVFAVDSSRCTFPSRINVTVEFGGSRVSSNCESSSLKVNAEGGNIYHSGGATGSENQTREIEWIMKEDIKTEILKKLGISTRKHASSWSPYKVGDVMMVKNVLRSDFIETKKNYSRYKYEVLFPVEEFNSTDYDSNQEYFSVLFIRYRNTTKDKVEVVDFWFYNDNYDEKYNMFPIDVKESSKRFEIKKRIILKNVKVEGGKWNRISLNVYSTMKLLNLSEEYYIHMYCEKCNTSLVNIPKPGMRPFLVLKMKMTPEKKFYRQRKPNHYSKIIDACKWPVTVDFKSFGWDKWVVLPKSFNTNYCRGSCTGDFDERFCNYPATAKISKRNMSPWDAPLSICCAPMVTSPLEIIYMDVYHSTVFTVIPDIIVEECGCSWKKMIGSSDWQ